MTHRLPRGKYFITSLENNENLGVSNIVPPIIPPPPVPVIVLPGGVLPPEFMVEPLIGGDNTYFITVEKRNVRGLEDRVFAFENEPPEAWVIIFREPQNAYTIEKIERCGEPLGWTIPSPVEPLPERQVLLRPVIATKSLPPLFLTSQLFRFEPVPEE